MSSLTSGTTPIDYGVRAYLTSMAWRPCHVDGVEVVVDPPSTPSPRLISEECVKNLCPWTRPRHDLHEHALEGQNPPFVVRLRQAEPHERPDLDLLLIIPPARPT